MKKLLLVTISIFFALITTAADLNPFAYGLSSSYDPSTYTLTVNYSLNALATRVDLVILDGATAVKTISFTNSGDISAGAHTVTPSMLGLAPKAGYTWKLNVYGAAKNAMTYCKTFGNYQQFAIDIDNNTNSPHFGRILTTQPVGYDSSDGKQNAGIYEWNPVSHTGTRYSGGIGYNTTQDWYNKNHVAPHRLRIAQDGTGRIYVTACDLSLGQYLWSVDPDNLNSWTQLLTTAQMKSHHGATGNLYSCGLDIRGEGDNINLLLFSGLMNTTGVGTNTNKVYICEYNPVSKTFVKSMTPASMTRATCTQTNAQYDQFGGVWYINYNGGADYKTAETGLKHITTNGTVKSWGNTNVNFQTGSCASAGFRHNVKENKIALSQYGNGKTFAIYTLGEKANQGATISPKLYNRFTPSQSLSAVGVSSYVEDFAWDYAGNLYVCTRNKVVVYADTLSANRAVTTPAPAGNTFEVILAGTSATINTAITPENSGTVTGGGTYEVGTKITLTATPAIGYEFIKWTDKSGTQLSTSATYQHTVTYETTITAHFQEANYNVTWWNLFKDKEDIYDSEIDTKRNARLYYLFMAYYNAGSGDGLRWAAKLDDGSGEYNVGNSCYTYADELLNGSSTAPMYWLGEYLKSVIGDSYTLQVGSAETYSVQWGKCMFAFINKVSYAKNYQGTTNTVPETLIKALKAFAPTSNGGSGASEPEKWRPWWTRIACELPNQMSYAQNMPVTWKKTAGPYGENYDTYENNTIPGNLQPIKTPKWYQWNTVSDHKDEYTLAWRKGDILGNIVHHISENNLQLHATYVKKIIDENDNPAKPLERDASNKDVIELLQNPNWDPSKNQTASHVLYVTRKLQGGMYNTICLPFDADVSSGKLVGYSGTEYNATFYELDTEKELSFLYNTEGEDVTVIHFKPTTTLVAGVPYLVLPTTDITEDIKFTALRTSLTLTATTTQTKDKRITFHGTINPTDIPSGSLILVANNRLAMNNEHQGTMAGMRGYFTIESEDVAAIDNLNEQAQNGRVYLSMSKPVTTSVPLAPEAELPAQPKVQKIMRNGKIYILRDGKVYTITGARVK